MVRVVCFAALLLAHGLPRLADELDGNRWLTISVEEREAFVGGYVDYQFDATQGLRLKASFYAYGKAITEYFQRTPRDRGRSIHEVLLQVAPSLPEPRDQRGERYSNAHGIFLLDAYWDGLSTALHVKYLEGYLSARRHDRDSTDKYSRSISWYESEITAESIRRAKSGLTTSWPIAYVLRELRDKQSARRL